MRKLYLDSESCGLHGLPVLFQYAVEDGPVVLYDIWKHPIGETLALIEWILTHTIVGFNLAFDFFHLCKTYTIFRLFPTNLVPEEHIDEIALKEPEGRDGPCLKPAGALDLLMYSRKGPMQVLMARDDVRIRKVPTALAGLLADELEDRIALEGILFARAKGGPRWKVMPRKKPGGEIDPSFSDVVLKFHPAGGLKFLAEYAMGLKPKYHYADVEPPCAPKELGYAPFALAVSRPPAWEVFKDGKVIGHAWPALVRQFIEHWASNEHAREYARDDVVYTRALDKHFGYPEPNDNDSILTCMVAAVRWHGFTIDAAAIRKLLADAQAKIDHAPVNFNKPSQVRRYVGECLDDVEKLIIAETTKKAKLEAISKLRVEEDEVCCKTGCPRCNGTGKLRPGPHPAAVRAKEVLELKIAAKEIELYKKLLRAGRFHASLKVIGTKSSRMSGADGLNPQGIKHTIAVRSTFPFKWGRYVLSLGDFSAFEVTIADAVCNDEGLRRELLAGKKIHALFGMALFPGMTYDEIKATADTENDLYTKGKQGFFGSILYGGDHNTLVNKLGVREQDARNAIATFGRRYPGVGAWQKRIREDFCSMRQPAGIGSAVVWNEPADYVETFLGFRRYFTLENKICRALFDLARKPPKEWKECKIKVLRRDRVQVACGAVSSALYGAAFQIQAANMRAAANHQIQSPGGEITKHVQRRIWDLQPVGVHEFVVAPFNCHDEILAVNAVPERVAEVVAQSVEYFRPKVPLIGMDWIKRAKNWGSKHGEGAEGVVTITYPKQQRP